jgi:uncharacterized membrane protein YjjP (DUF1212 family)
MAITLCWIPDTNIIHFISDGKWTWQDFYDSMSQLYNMIDECDYEHVDYILDITKGDLFPQNALSQFRRVSTHTHEKSRYMIFVGVGGFANVLMKMMRHVIPDRMSFCMQAETLEEARLYLAHKLSEQEMIPV